jgi:starch-binding outer membrane protein, SusD/RagB family
VRLADVYLIYAEAILGYSPSTSDAEALKYFNMVRSRAGVLPKPEITWDDIYNERRLEFAMEGQAWYEMTRLHYYNPQKAYAMLSSQNRGSYRIDPNTPTKATSWTIKPLTERKIQVSEANFMLPIPAGELTIAPNLRKTPVPYDFTK